MTYRQLFSRVVASGFALSVATVIACSSGTTTVVMLPAEGGTSTPADGGVPNCTKSTTFIECLLCCGTPDQAFLDAQTAFDQCRCDTCKTQCAATGCNPPDASSLSQECATCLQATATGQACFPAADKICSANPGCESFQTCTEQSKCNDKPDDADGG